MFTYHLQPCLLIIYSHVYLSFTAMFTYHLQPRLLIIYSHVYLSFTAMFTYHLQPCSCDPEGSLDNNCDPLTGQCICRSDYTGLQCNSCMYGSYNFPDCTDCECSVEGTEPTSCNSQGQCHCEEPNGQCLCKVSISTNST